LPNEASPRVLNRSWTLTADIDASAADVEGMIVTQGGLIGGYGLYVRDRKPTFVYNYLSEERFTFTAKQPLPRGKSQIRIDFAYDGAAGERGKGARVTMTVNGTRVAEGQLPKTIPILISLNEGLDVGEDYGSPVDFTYKLPFRFTGGIEKVTFDLK
jgi:arylsulfatase